MLMGFFLDLFACRRFRGDAPPMDVPPPLTVMVAPTPFPEAVVVKPPMGYPHPTIEEEQVQELEVEVEVDDSYEGYDDPRLPELII
ncbi:uncharacterized protein [Drosophila pseudoobscura]|uniref:Uncharacterized protein n=1 Tax=Drosophila pseudoobscura pseudoobscura TaxID=46245 RepID=A0A6I8V067_DROPS|nr:uncharacterized protein LOC6901141 [Drosophila pseudoobscura]